MATPRNTRIYRTSGLYQQPGLIENRDACEVETVNSLREFAPQPPEPKPNNERMICRQCDLGLLDRLELEIVLFHAGDAREAGTVRSELEAEGLPISLYDLLIAGQARARNLVLVTASSRELERVQELVCEDWTLSGADPARARRGR